MPLAARNKTRPHFGLFLPAGAGVDVSWLARLSLAIDVRQYKTIDEVQPIDGDIVIVPSEQAARLLERYATQGGWLAIVLRDGGPLPDEVLLADDRVLGVLDAGSGPEACFSMVKTGQQLLIGRAHGNAGEMLESVLEVGRALASEKDLDTLLNLILDYARRLTGADGSSIYTRDPNGKLYFRLWQNASTDTTSEAQKTLVGDYSIAGYVARTGEIVNIGDAYAIPKQAPYQFNPASDRSIGYRSVSMLTVPLTNKGGEVVGVLQLINRKADYSYRLASDEDYRTKVLPFEDDSVQVVLALAGQAGVALENSMLHADIERLFEGFIKASVQAIEARDPTTAGHSFRVAEFTERLSRAADRADTPTLRAVSFSREQIREIRYAALLHDFGKVGVRENVLVKPKKLHPHELELLKQRFLYAQAQLARRAHMEMLALYDNRRLGDEERLQMRAQINAQLVIETQKLDRYLHTVLQANEPTVSETEVTGLLDEVANYHFLGENEQPVPLLQPFEFENLALAKGSLSPAERGEIESHVTHTFSFLSLIPWTRNLAGLPQIAYAHHEKLDGSGYPRGLTGEEIPVQSKIMTIADIYDALTASDRPYKAALPAERALDILGHEARSGKLDPGLLDVFIESNAWELIAG